MNHVTQQNAAISEESASALTEINSEIMTIRRYIRNVAELADGNPSAPSKAPAMASRGSPTLQPA